MFPVLQSMGAGVPGAVGARVTSSVAGEKRPGPVNVPTQPHHVVARTALATTPRHACATFSQVMTS